MLAPDMKYGNLQKDKAREIAQLLIENEDLIHNIANNFQSHLYEGKTQTTNKGKGDDFWQYRQFANGEDAKLIDWRASSKNDKLFVKEQQNMVPYKIAIWLDNSPQMQTSIDDKRMSKIEIGAIIAIALEIALKKLSTIVVNCGAKINRPFIECLLQNGESFLENFSPFITIIISDGLRPLEFWNDFFSKAQAKGAKLFIININDYSEIAFDFSGNCEFLSPDFHSPNTEMQIMKIADCDAIKTQYIQLITKHFEDFAQLIAKFHFASFNIRNDIEIIPQTLEFWRFFNQFIKIQ
jgi:Protein of unknown function DUF58